MTKMDGMINRRYYNVHEERHERDLTNRRTDSGKSQGIGA